MKKYLHVLVGIILASTLATVSAVTFSAIVRRSLSGPVVDGIATDVRLGRYGEPYVIPLTTGYYGLADEGSYFHAMTATPGTAFTLTGATQTAWVATTPTFTVKNNDVEAAKRLYMDFVRINWTTIGTAGTRIEGAVVIDNVTRYSSAGTALTVYNVNMDSAAASISTQAFGGAITATAATAPRYVCRFALKSAIAVIGDGSTISFGSPSLSSTTSATPSFSATCPPVLVGGGDSFLLYTWQPGQSAAPTGEVSAGWWER